MTEWFNNRGTGVAIGVDDPRLLLVGDGIPDWVRLPRELEGPDAGRELKVTGHFVAHCPKCKRENVRHLVLEDNYRNAECVPGCGFVTYRIRLV